MNAIQDKKNVEESVKEILMQIILENNEIELEGDWCTQLIDSEFFDSITMVSFMVNVEEMFHIYIDEMSMEKLDFMNSYQDMINGIVMIIDEKDVKECIENANILIN